MKKLAAFAALLLLAGISLTLYLPDYQPKVAGDKVNYQIDQDSLKTPLLMADTLLTTFEEQDTQYGLQLGLFSQLQQAITQANKMALADLSDSDPLIFKATDHQRFWYLLVLGPFDSKNQSTQQSLRLQQSNSIEAKVMRWPIAKDETSEDTTTEPNS